MAKRRSTQSRQRRGRRANLSSYTRLEKRPTRYSPEYYDWFRSVTGHVRRDNERAEQSHSRTQERRAVSGRKRREVYA